MNVLSAYKIANNKRQLLVKLIFPTQRVFVNGKDYLDSAAGHLKNPTMHKVVKNTALYLADVALVLRRQHSIFLFNW